MPSRMIRDGLLDSERYWSVSIEARQLFLHLMLLADDFGCVSLAPLFLRRRCFNDTPSTEKIGRLITELNDADLIRCYEVDRSCYAFIPRFRQRLQRETLKHPKPPEALFRGDDAEEKFKKIKKDTEKPTVLQPLANAGQPPEVKRREEKNTSASAFVLPAWVSKDDWKAFEEMRTKLRKAMTDRARSLVLAELAKLRDAGHDPSAVLNQSIRRGWLDVFPLKGDAAPVAVPWAGAK